MRKRIRYTFSSAGILMAITDLNGSATTLAYAADGSLATVTAASGRSLSFAYDPAGRVSAVTDSLPRRLSYTNDSAGELQTVTDADGQGWTYDYDGAHRITSVKDPRGATTTNTYDPTSGRVISQQDRRGKATAFRYTGPGSDGTSTTTITPSRFSGTPPGGRIAVTGSLCFGGVKACCRAERTLTIANGGPCPLHVTAVSFTRALPFWRLVNNPFPATLASGALAGRRRPV